MRGMESEIQILLAGPKILQRQITESKHFSCWCRSGLYPTLAAKTRTRRGWGTQAGSRPARKPRLNARAAAGSACKPEFSTPAIHPFAHPFEPEMMSRMGFRLAGVKPAAIVRDS